MAPLVLSIDNLPHEQLCACSLLAALEKQDAMFLLQRRKKCDYIQGTLLQCL